MSSMNSEKLPYTEYQLILSIGLMSKQTDTVHPNIDFIKEEWNSFTREEQETWLDEQTREWANNYIDYGWHIDRESD
ncbi:MAG: hypothetical protein N4J56_007126 [Chroococcidiopsis sp. SAG 2025]|nr:hypothetical protein [Chroococcidiopsis sp. SAG 2025]